MSVDRSSRFSMASATIGDTFQAAPQRVLSPAGSLCTAGLMAGPRRWRCRLRQGPVQAQLQGVQGSLLGMHSNLCGSGNFHEPLSMCVTGEDTPPSLKSRQLPVFLNGILKILHCVIFHTQKHLRYKSDITIISACTVLFLVYPSGLNLIGSPPKLADTDTVYPAWPQHQSSSPTHF